MSDKTRLTLIILIVIVAIPASFFVTTWLAMLLGGMIGHFIDSDWLKNLSYWQYAPVWVMAIIVRVLFK